MTVPPEYEGREQSWLKHRVLEEYLAQWSHKIGSVADTEKMWFVDCFSGPWKNKDQDLRDTSIDIGLRALRSAQNTYKKKNGGRSFQLGAVFVEKDPRAFAELETYLDNHQKGPDIDIHPIAGQFGEHVPHITSLLRSDPAFIFVDPTGFKGAAMDFIRPLLKPRMRDVLVNVMYGYVNRLATELQEHIRPFFRVEIEELRDLSEDEILGLYRNKLKRYCGLSHAADLRIPHPTQERTKFRLVVGGKNKAVLRVFRDVEDRVLGGEAGHARDAARRADRTKRTGADQLGLFASAAGTVRLPDDGYAVQHAEDLVLVRKRLVESLPLTGSRRWEEIWPRLLEEHHVTLSQLGHAAGRMARDGTLLVTPWTPRRQIPRDDDHVARGRALDSDSPP